MGKKKKTRISAREEKKGRFPSLPGGVDKFCLEESIQCNAIPANENAALHLRSLCTTSKASDNLRSQIPKFPIRLRTVLRRDPFRQKYFSFLWRRYEGGSCFTKYCTGVVLNELLSTVAFAPYSNEGSDWETVCTSHTKRPAMRALFHVANSTALRV